MGFAMSPVVRSVIVASLIVIGSPINAQEAPAPAASSEKPGVTAEEKRERAEDAIDEAADATKSAIERAKEAVIDAIASRDAIQARTIAARLSLLPAEAIEAMKQTPVGEIPQIPVSLKKTNVCYH